jgi:hypothetical protein
MIIPVGQKYWYCDLNNGKIQYILRQHFLLNRKFHPLLLFTYVRGATVKNEAHVCTSLAHQEQVEAWNRSKRREDNKKALECQEGTTSTYKSKNHVTWVCETTRVYLSLDCTLIYCLEVTSDLTNSI